MSQNTSQDQAGERSAGAAKEPGLPGAVSRLVGIHLAALALTVTYLVAVLDGVSAPTALLRAGIVFAIVLILGRVTGYLVGQTLERALTSDGRVNGAETGS